MEHNNVKLSSIGKSMLRYINVTLVVFLVVGVVAGAFGAGYLQGVMGQSPSPSSQVQSFPIPGLSGASLPPEFAIIEEVWDILNEDFVDASTMDAKELRRGALEGIIAALDDPHTSYIDAENYRAERSDIRGSYEGIGASVALVDGVLTVIAPLPGSPAEEAGILSGDSILEIDGESTRGLSLADAVTKVKGPRGTKVALLIQHKDAQESVLVEVVRAEIRTNSVLFRMLPEGFAHIRIVQFSQRTGTELHDMIQRAVAENATGIVLDVRNNPGGLLDTTVVSVSHFLSGGLAGYQVDRDGNRKELPLHVNSDATDLPTVILVNQGSASGSELLAGAMQDRKRALLIGTRTFGKGSVNHLRELSDGSALYVTIGRWLTPSGRLIEGNGLEPDIEVRHTEESLSNGIDLQMEYAIKALQAQINGEELPVPPPTPAPTVSPTPEATAVATPAP